MSMWYLFDDIFLLDCVSLDTYFFVGLCFSWYLFSEGSQSGFLIFTFKIDY